MQNAIVRLRGPSGAAPVRELLLMDPREMSDFDAGVHFAALLNTVNPNASWNSIFSQYSNRYRSLGKSWFMEYIVDPVKSVAVDPLHSAISEVVGGVSDRTSSVIDKLTSDKLITNVNKAFKGFTDGGGVMGAIGTNKWADAFSGGSAGYGDVGSGSENQGFLSMIGGLWKKAFSGNIADTGSNQAGIMDSGMIWIPVVGVGLWVLFKGTGYRAPKRRRKKARAHG